ncbi:hypothetical protein ADUPG1_007040, partial [Aduncisulcus paluster]
AGQTKSEKSTKDEKDKDKTHTIASTSSTIHLDSPSISNLGGAPSASPDLLGILGSDSPSPSSPSKAKLSSHKTDDQSAHTLKKSSSLFGSTTDLGLGRDGTVDLLSESEPRGGSASLDFLTGTSSKTSLSSKKTSGDNRTVKREDSMLSTTTGIDNNFLDDDDDLLGGGTSSASLGLGFGDDSMSSKKKSGKTTSKAKKSKSDIDLTAGLFDDSSSYL